MPNIEAFGLRIRWVRWARVPHRSGGRTEGPIPLAFAGAPTGSSGPWSFCGVDISIQVPLSGDRVSVLGSAERNLKMIREALGVNITARNSSVHLKGDRRGGSVARSVIQRLESAAGDERGVMSREQVLDLIADESERYRTGRGGGGAGGRPGAGGESGHPSWEGALDVYASGRPIRGKTANQEVYLEAIRTHDM